MCACVHSIDPITTRVRGCLCTSVCLCLCLCLCLCRVRVCVHQCHACVYDANRYQHAAAYHSYLFWRGGPYRQFGGGGPSVDNRVGEFARSLRAFAMAADPNVRFVRYEAGP